MNKCLSLVHLTSRIGSQSSGSDESTSWFLRCPKPDLDQPGTKSVSGRLTLIAAAQCSALRLNFRAGMRAGRDRVNPGRCGLRGRGSAGGGGRFHRAIRITASVVRKQRGECALPDPRLTLNWRLRGDPPSLAFRGETVSLPGPRLDQSHGRKR